MKNDIVMPNYDHCILNTITSVLKYYKVDTPFKSLKVLDDKLSNKDYRNIVFILLDGMGEHILKNLNPNNYFTQNEADCVTSVYPSTTTAALTSYYSGKPPIETGWIAWSQYFKEYGRAVDMLSHRESYFREEIKKPTKNVFEEVVNYKTIFDQIEEASPEVKAYEVEPSYTDKRSKRSMRADNIDEIVMCIEDICSIPSKNFIFAYSDKPDQLLHKYGADSDEAKQYIQDAERKIRDMVERLPQDTLVIVTADHGHRNIDNAYTLLDYPEIMECLIMPPSLESRTIAFWVKEHMRSEFTQRFNKIFRDEFWLMTREEFLEKNFLGVGKKHPKVDEFIGNYIALSTSGSIIRIETFLVPGKEVKKSTHCGLTRDEMEVPVIIVER